MGFQFPIQAKPLIPTLASILFLCSCASSTISAPTSSPLSSNNQSTMENRGVASQNSQDSTTTSVARASINCVPNRGASVAYEFYEPSVDLDFSILVITSEDSIQDHLISKMNISIDAESTMKMALTPSGTKYFQSSGSNLSFRAEKIIYRMAQNAPRKNPSNALIILPAGLRINLHLQKINTPQGRFELAGSLSTADYEMNLVCNFLAPSK